MARFVIKFLNLLLILLLSTTLNFTVLAAQSTVSVQITGMHCESCAKSLKKKFKKQDSVENISVDFSTQTFTIDIKDSASLTDKAIKDIIDWGGYELIEIKRP